MSDQLSIKERTSSEPCPFTRIETVLGRDEDILWFEGENGTKEFLHPLAVEGFCVEGLLDYQFRQTDKAVFEMLVETTQDADRGKVRKELLEQVKKVLREKQLLFVNFVACVSVQSRTAGYENL